jgi:hypothetical protein
MGSERAKEAHDRAEAQFQKKAKAGREGDAARAEYAAVSRAVDEKTVRLKSLRLAKEASDAETASSERSVLQHKKPK